MHFGCLELAFFIRAQGTSQKILGALPLAVHAARRPMKKRQHLSNVS